MLLLCAKIAFPVPYLDWDDANKQLVEKTGDDACKDYALVTANDTAWGAADSTTPTWYVVNSDVEIATRVTVSGDVHLILKDSAELNAKKGIVVTGNNSLTIYAQSTGETMGALSAKGDFSAAGIGGDQNGAGGKITVNGGTVTATGGSSGAGIGGGTSGGSNGGKITVNGGSGTATGGTGAAGIGGGNGTGTISLGWTDKDNDSITASSYGGTVTLEKRFQNKTTGTEVTANDFAALQNATVVALLHAWTYALSEDNATITATCGVEGCDITEGLSLTISAPTALTYDGTPKAASLNTDYNTTAFPGTYTIAYAKSEETLEAAPTDAA